MKLPSRPQDKIIIALDVPDTDGALRLIDSIADHGEPPALCKIGLELFTAEGPSVVKAVKARGCEIFLDLKFHDIPNTVAHAIRSAAGLGVAMTTIHAVGGSVMMEAAAKAAEKMELLILAVTVLTSMDSDQLSSTGINVEPKEQVLRLVRLAAKAGIGGIVCSPLEISAIRESFDEKLRIVTPGVRPIWAAAGDQKRVMTPAEAVAAGSDWLVIGRPITASENPKEAYAKVVAELS